jgi:hypothetical protein
MGENATNAGSDLHSKGSPLPVWERLIARLPGHNWQC